MLKRIFLHAIFLIFISSNLICVEKKEICICSTFHEIDYPYLKEWITYHKILGVKKFFLYDVSTESSERDYYNYIGKEIFEGQVVIFFWPSPYDENYSYYKVAAYNNCLKMNRKKYKWIAFIDTDEFIVPVGEHTLKKLLKDVNHMAGLQIYYQTFGPNCLKEIDLDFTLIESLYTKAPVHSELNKTYRTICQPNKVYYVNEFSAVYYDLCFPVFVGGKAWVKEEPYGTETIRINKYWSRDAGFLFKKKAPLEIRAGNNDFSEENLNKKISKTSLVEDTTIFKYVEKLRKKLKLPELFK